MPQVSDRFGPIPSSVVLDGSGNGQLTFQVNGSNCRITNLYVKVSTTTNQAVCKMYKGQVADSNLIQSTNSGSTGATASGAIDLTDGETLFVVWTGGDAGATAYATFTGVKIPFSEVGPSSIEWSDPIAAGDGSLVYPALKSPDYVTGVSGWIIRRDGSVEFSNGVFRGNVIIDGATSFLLLRGPNNSDIEMFASGGTPVILFLPPDTGATVSIGEGAIYTDIYDQALQKYIMIMSSPFPNGGTPAEIYLTSSNKTGSDQPTVQVHGTLSDYVSGQNYLNGITGTGSTAVGAAATSIVTAGTTFTFTRPFPVGVVPNVHVNMNNNAAATATWNARAVGISNTGFDIRASGAAPGGAGFTLGFQYTAIAPA